MGRLSWIIEVQMWRGEQKDLRRLHCRLQKSGRGPEPRREGMKRRRLEQAGKPILPEGPQRECGPARHFGLGPVADFRPPELEDNEFVLL